VKSKTINELHSVLTKNGYVYFKILINELIKIPKMKLIEDDIWLISCSSKFTILEIEKWICLNSKNILTIKQKNINVSIKDNYVYILGKKIQIEWIISNKRRKYEFGTNNNIFVFLKAEDDPLFIIKKILQKEALPYFIKRTSQINKTLNLKVNEITIKNFKRRWGHCSARGCICYATTLYCLNPELGDSVIFHELAHLTHFNHSKDFFTLLTKYCPNYLALRIKLNNEAML